MARTATFTVTLSEPSPQKVSVAYRTVDLTATAPSDYTTAEGILTFDAGQVSKTITIPVRDDAVGQPAERFLVTLYNPKGCKIARVDGACDIPAGSTGGGGTQNGPLILYGLITNAYHNELGRGGYFHHNSGTSEGQSIGIEGSLLAYQALSGGTIEENQAAEWYKANGLSMLDALGNDSRTGPMLRQPVSSNKDTITLLHWLFAARGSIPSQGINYELTATKSGNKLVIPATVSGHKGGADVFRVWQIYPATSYLLYNSPYSPSYDSVNPTADTSIMLSDDDWKKVGNTVEITIPAGAPSGVTQWKIVYGYQNAGTIKQGQAEEAYPCWTPIDPGYSACAPDTFRWFEYAMTLAMQVDNRTGKAVRWQNLRDAMRRTAVRGQSITDLREIIKPMPQFDPIPIKGEPSGMFCYSNHPAALPPSNAQISAGANAAWIGFNFWSRVGGAGGTVSPGVYTWTPDNMLDVTPAGNMFNGAIEANVPAADDVRQVQIGRGINDQWRVANDYQQADQFLFVAIRLSRRPNFALGERCYVFLSTTKYYDPLNRYYADIGQSLDLAIGDVNKPGYVLIPRTAFTRKDGDNAVLPAGTKFENFGVSMEMQGAYNLRIVAMRLVSGPSEQWVRDNLKKAVGGSPMPFFPGSMPFAINADTIKQQFIGWNGSPFHGYQLPDFWYFLQPDATYVHPGIKAADLPVPSATTGAIQYPISATTSGGATKPSAALLCEQQVLFLKHAQDKWEADGGASGPFAHTFVMNTPARMSIGNPTPHTWVYTNDDPNTRWVGYQVRVIDSLSRLVYLSRANNGYADVNALSLSMAMKFIDRLNVLWPNLNGVTVNGVRIYGMPTDFDDPAKGAPQTNYEEPHAAALILRACMWLKLSGKLNSTQLATVNAVGKRCWDYMEMRYRKAPLDSMKYTWANDNETWYGFWHFEIVATIAYLLKNPTGTPDGIDTTLLRKRLVETQSWLVNNVR